MCHACTYIARSLGSIVQQSLEHLLANRQEGCIVCFSGGDTHCKALSPLPLVQPSLSSVVAGGSVVRPAVRSGRAQSDSSQEDTKGKAR